MNAPAFVHLTSGAVVEIGTRLAFRRHELADRIVARIRAEIPDYRLVDEELISSDVRSITLSHLDLLTGALTEERTATEEDFAATRAGGARRVHQGISLESFGRAARLWGHCLWDAVLEEADADVPAEREAALLIAGRVMEHVDQLSVAVAEGYMHELQTVWSDREVVRRDLLDGLVSGQGDTERVRRLARSLKLQLTDLYVAIVLRGPDGIDEAQAGEALEERVALREIVDAALEHLRCKGPSLLVGMRHGEVVALCPVSDMSEVDGVLERADALAAALAGADVGVGVGSCHATLAEVATGYQEARDAAEIAVGTGIRGRPLHFDEVLLDHMVRASPHADRIEATLQPLLDYDAGKHSQLVATLRAYVECGFNLTRSAEVLHVHPNTVVYRLRRIRELSGRDPHDPNDLLLLFLGLKLSGLRSRP